MRTYSDNVIKSYLTELSIIMNFLIRMELNKLNDDRLIIIQKDNNIFYLAGISFFLFAVWVLYAARNDLFFGVLISIPSILIGIMIIKAGFYRQIEINNIEKQIIINNRVFNINKNNVIKFKQIKKAAYDFNKENSCYIVNLKLENGMDFKLLQEKNDKKNISEVTNFINKCIGFNTKQKKEFKFQ